MPSGFSDREIVDAIYEIRDRTTRIEARMERMDTIEQTAIDAKDTASKALYKSEENERSISGIKKANYWAWGFVITFILGAAAVVLYGG